MDYVVETDVPIPVTLGGRGRAPIALLVQMRALNIGESFVVPKAEVDSTFARRLGNEQQNGRRNGGRHYVWMRLVDGSYRIWRDR